MANQWTELTKVLRDQACLEHFYICETQSLSRIRETTTVINFGTAHTENNRSDYSINIDKAP